MFDHIMVKVKDLNSSKRFYTAALAPAWFQRAVRRRRNVRLRPEGRAGLVVG